jgi:hypothetical protein
LAVRVSPFVVDARQQKGEQKTGILMVDGVDAEEGVIK